MPSELRSALLSSFNTRSQARNHERLCLRLRVCLFVVLLSFGIAEGVRAQTFSDSLTGASGPGVLMYWPFTCSYWATHNDDGGPLQIHVKVEALDPDGRVLASDTQNTSSGSVNMSVVGNVNYADLRDEEYHCFRTALYPSRPDAMVSGKIACQDGRTLILREYGIESVGWAPTCEALTRLVGVPISLGQNGHKTPVLMAPDRGRWIGTGPCSLY